jgi:hypothetical protein
MTWCCFHCESAGPLSGKTILTPNRSNSSMMIVCNEKLRASRSGPHVNNTSKPRPRARSRIPGQARAIQPQSAVSFVRTFFDDFHSIAGGMVPQDFKLGHDRMLRLLCRAGNPRIESGSHFLLPPE